MKWERARSEKQKEVRVSEIVAATERLYKKYSFDEITFVLIAEEANFTRSNLYKYFNSKEEIFLEFLKQDIIAFRKDVVKSYKKNKNYTPEEFVSIWVGILNSHGRMLDLLSILFHFLEKYSSVESVAEFKFSIKEELTILIGLLCETFPGLMPDKALEFLYLFTSMSVGLHQMTTYTDNQIQAMEENPELRDLMFEFDTYYEYSILYLLKGVLAQ